MHQLNQHAQFNAFSKLHFVVLVGAHGLQSRKYHIILDWECHSLHFMQSVNDMNIVPFK
jgi:hypothetical protein